MDTDEEKSVFSMDVIEKKNKIEAVVELVEDSEISSIKNIVKGIITVIDNPRSSIKDLKELIECDPPLAASILKTANSAYYRHPKRMSDIEQAVIWIGFDELKELALKQKVSEIFAKDKAIEGYSRKLLWKHSVAVAMLSKMIYRKEFGQKGSDIYAAGLLHDIGIIVEDQFFLEDFIRAVSKSENKKMNLAEVEHEVFGYNHAEIGKALAENFGLPGDLVMTIAHHHNPYEGSKYPSRSVLTLYISDYLCQQINIGYGDASFSDKALFNKCITTLGLAHRAMELILKELENEISKMKKKGLF